MPARVRSSATGVIAIIAWLAGVCVAQDVVHLVKGKPVCRTREDLDQIYEIGRQGDTVAVDAMVTEGRCAFIDKARRAFVVETERLNTRWKVRPEGSTVAVWVRAEALSGAAPQPTPRQKPAPAKK